MLFRCLASRFECRASGSRIAAGLLLALLALPACKATIGPADKDDDVREENLELRDRVADLEEKLELRTAQIASMRQAEENRANAAAVPEAEPLVLTKLDLGDYSGLIDTDGDGKPNLARAYARPRDQRGRFTPVAGEALLQVFGLPASDGPTAQPVKLAERVYAPAEWDDAYRTGFTGTHYTVEADLDPARLDGLSGAVIRVVLTQAESGIRVQDQASRSIQP
ncbi:MAG: hypothetical protein AAGB29_10115 [Planctomycetota bacterium]